MANHILDSHMLNFKVKPGSRNRVRVPVSGTRFTKAIKPGDRVQVNCVKIRRALAVEIKVDPNGNYKVEKNGGIRFPATKFGLKPDKLYVMTDSIKGDVMVFNN